MKKYSSVLALFFLTFTIHAQSVWSGNASVGGSSDFPGKSEVFRAASNSFPEGTVLQVTNPRGGAEVNVTVIGRLESPGVFILIEESAASVIGLPDDHVLPVRVTPISAAVVAESELVISETGEKTEDPDYNPAVSIDKIPDEETPETDDPPEENKGSKVFFLTPSDLRPPDVETDVENVPTPVLASYIPVAGKSYVQVGAYGSREVLDESLDYLQSIAPGYPLSMDSVTDKGRTVYKLLIGPLTPAETGIVLKTARSSAFPDAFFYSK
ncbi:MAG: SPOR domain-containing protein [Spirochaetaceae bacterium]|nr:SPOR domain-containing protein [Spirochaetaceae bacterium]